MTEGKVDGKPIRRKSGRLVLPAAVLVLVAIITIGTGFAITPRYNTIESLPIVDDAAAIRVDYPTGWVGSISDFTVPSDGESLIPGHVLLVPPKPTGISAWIESMLQWSKPQEWQDTLIAVQLEHRIVTGNIDSDAQRMAGIFSQLSRQGVSCSMRRDRCKAGDLLIADMQFPAASKTPNRRTILLYPPRAANGRQYEVSVVCTMPRSMKSRVDAVALDVVSRIRVVQAK